jgi:hypothetical protein
VKLHVLTAVSRPENLGFVADSLAKATSGTRIEICWHWRLDLARQHIGGQAVKNAMLDTITDGWVWCLDDDTLAHEDVLRAFEVGPHHDAFILSQRRVTGRVLVAAPENVQVGEIDIGQAMLRREWIGDRRIPEDYNGDGMFLREVLHGARIVWVPEPFSLHNAISQVEVSV